MNVEKLMKHIVPFFIGRNGLARYKMSTCPRGLCLIINNKNFKNPEYNREGAQKDEEDLNSLFKKLHFTVYVKNDLTRGEMEDVAKEFGGKDYGNFDAFVFIIMSHGGKKDVIFGVDEKKTSIKDLTSEFRSDCCPTLKGKPKLVIIQSCRGSHTDVSYRSADASPTVDSTLVKGVFPKEADFLFAFSTPPDYVAYRYDSGSPFIQVCSIGRTGNSLFLRRNLRNFRRNSLTPMTS